MNMVELARAARRENPDVSTFLIVHEPYKKADWMICPACGLPQDMVGGGDDEYDPPGFMAYKPCIHCNFELDSDDDPAKYDVEAGKAQVQAWISDGTYWRSMAQETALRQYAEAS